VPAADDDAARAWPAAVANTASSNSSIRDGAMAAGLRKGVQVCDMGVM